MWPHHCKEKSLGERPFSDKEDDEPVEGRPGPVDNTRRVLLARAGDLFASKPFAHCRPSISTQSAPIGSAMHCG